LKTRIESSRTIPPDPKLAIKTAKKASESFKGWALRRRSGHWGITKVQQIPNLKRCKEESGQGGLQERKEEGRGQGSGGFGSKGFMVNC